MGGATEKDWLKRPSDHQLQEAQKKTERTVTPVVEAVCVPAHLALPGPCKPNGYTTFTLNSHWGGAATGKKKKSCIYAHRVTLVMSNCLWPVDCGLPGFSVRGVLQARMLESIGQYWLPCPSRALYFLLPSLPTPLSTWCCQNPCDPSSRTTSTPDPHRGRPKFSRAASGANPSGQPTCRGGNKITIETQGQCG